MSNNLKASVADALESLIGEYVLNISKENIKVSVLRGKVKLDNVQLDGDAMASLLFDSNDFAVLSCQAKQLKCSVHWSLLEKEPARMEFKHLHLLVVPVSYASHSKYAVMLRSKAKRSALARLERNFLAGKMPDEPTFIPTDGSDELESSSEKLSFVAKMKRKAFSNVEFLMKDVHIRFECPNNLIALSRNLKGEMFEALNRSDGFCCGMTVHSFSIRSCTSNWSTDMSGYSKRIREESLSRSNLEDKMKAAAILNTKHRLIRLENSTAYWDDNPSCLISTFVIPGISSDLDSNHNKEHQGFITAAMDASSQEEDLTSIVQKYFPKYYKQHRSIDQKHLKSSHSYFLDPFTCEARATFYDEALSNLPICVVESLPCELKCIIRPEQYHQFSYLRNSIEIQQRFDTLLHKRPTQRPSRNNRRATRDWWKFLISCVMTRPRSRPWRDVVRIVECRETYIELVLKRLENQLNTSGYYRGLSRAEAEKLSEITEFLPLEVLLSFHLVALRKSVAKKQGGINENNRLQPISRFKALFSSRNKDNDKERHQLLSLKRNELKSRNMMNINLNRASSTKPQLNLSSLTEGFRFIMHNFRASIGLCMNERNSPFIKFELESRGLMRSFDSGLSTGLFDLLRLNIYDVIDNRQSQNPILTVDQSELSHDNSFSLDLSQYFSQMSISIPAYIESQKGDFFNINQLFKTKVASRIMVMSDERLVTSDIISFPANIIWNQDCMDSIANFLASPINEIEAKLKSRLAKSATPLAKKAFAASISPKSLDIHLNIEAPKIWIPISPGKGEDGALYCDAGHLIMKMQKHRQETISKWNIDINDIHLKFLSKFDSVFDEKYGTPIIMPFQVKVNAEIAAESITHETNAGVIGAGSHANIVVGTILLNLADVDIVAKAIGRLYASIIEKESYTNSSSRKSKEFQMKKMSSDEKVISKVKVHASISKIEMTMVGHSLVPNEGTKGRRRYLVTLLGINIMLVQNVKKQATLSLKDLSIVQNKSSSNLKVTDSVTEPWRFVLSKRQREAQSFHLLDEDISHSFNSSENNSFVNTFDDQGLVLDSSFFDNESGRREQKGHIVKLSYVHDGYIDEVEIDFEPIVIRVTPTSLRDSIQGLRRVIEVSRIIGKEMERKVHAESRLAREKYAKTRRKRKCEEDFMDNSAHKQLNVSSDSSFLLKVIFKNATILAGRPISEGTNKGTTLSAVVIQSSLNSLLMFQSIENADGSGTQTLHLSVDDFSASILNIFDPTLKTDVPLIFGPVAAELRVVSSTENLGVIVTQDYSFDCESIRSCVSSDDIKIIQNIYRKMKEKLEKTRYHQPEYDILQDSHESPLLSIKNKGSGIATNVRLELQTISFVLMNIAHKAQPFLDVCASPIKCNLEGCASAMSGECSAVFSLNFFNTSVKCDWEPVIEPWHVVLALDQMPDEVACNVASADDLCVNVSNEFLRDVSEVGESYFLSKSSETSDELSLSVFESLAKRKVSRSFPVLFRNECGIDIVLSPSSDIEHHKLDSSRDLLSLPNTFCVKNMSEIDLRNHFEEFESRYMPEIGGYNERPTITLGLDPSSSSKVGERPFITGLPIISSNGFKSLHKVTAIGEDYKTKLYLFEPVVEWCMQNQRLRVNVSDVYSLHKGEDLLSSVIWSPGDYFFCKEHYRDFIDQSFSVDDKDNADLPAVTSQGNWLRPNEMDFPEWTDMTCILRMERDRVMLPDNNWVWCNDWTVDVSGEIGVNIDSDGWEYQYDFDSFNMFRRTYKRGDTVRRRRWTRTRMIMPPKLDDPYRPLSIIWESVRSEDGGYSLTCRSHLQVHNNSNVDLSFFMFSQSWEKRDVYVGQAVCGEKLRVPLQFATGTHLRMGMKRNFGNSSKESNILSNFMLSERLMILPTNFISSHILRCKINCDDSKDDTRPINLVVRIKSEGGITDIFIDPVLRIANLLPCAIQCQLGEAIPEYTPPCERGAGMINRGRVSVETSEESKITIIDPSFKPHVSFRVPGYNWSQWYRIVNRKSKSETWVPTENDLCGEFRSSEENSDHSDEYKTIVQFDHLNGGDPLLLILSIQQGHCPILRIYAQYWIVNKTGFGLRFCEGVSLLGGPVGVTSRRSYTLPQESLELKDDEMIAGHEWTLGMSGMTLYFSSKQKLCFRIENMEDCGSITGWTSLLDISNVMPRTVITIDEEGTNSRRFEFAVEITLCQSVFTRTKLITIIPRYLIINLLDFDLLVSQYGSVAGEKRVPKQASLPYHWDEASLPPQIRLASVAENDEVLWTNGCFQLDQIGISAIRLPTPSGGKVVQIEVRLASKTQSCAVAVVIWSTRVDGNPLYMLRNISSKTMRCSQLLRQKSDDGIEKRYSSSKDYSFLWTLSPNESFSYGFEDPERSHKLEWFVVHDSHDSRSFSKSTHHEIDVDSMGSYADLAITEQHKIRCQVKAERSTKVIEFTDVWNDVQVTKNDYFSDFLEFSFRLDIPGISMSFIDTTVKSTLQGRDGHHSFELVLDSVQIDNHIPESSHSVLVFCPNFHNRNEPFLHVSALRILQPHPDTYFFSYVATRMLDMEIFLDRRSAETIAKFAQPLRVASERRNEVAHDPRKYVKKLTVTTSFTFANMNPRKASRNVEETALNANSGRIYLQHLLLHPVRLSLTFTQESIEWNSVTEGLMVFQLIRAMASISDAPLTFTSFVVDHAFESPNALLPIIHTHYTSQFSKQIFNILGSLNILRTGGDFLGNIGNGVKDFFYEPINGMMHSPAHFIEGLEMGTQSLARNLVLGISQGAANVTDVVNSNLTSLTDREFIEERKAHRRMLAEAINRSSGNRSIHDSVVRAGSSISMALRSGAKGIIDQPSKYASEHGTVGFIQGIGQGLIGAIVKPVIGIGDAAVLVMQHVSDVTSEKMPLIRNPRRLRRALPLYTVGHQHVAHIVPYDDSAAMAQKIVSSDGSITDIYLGHLNLPNQVVIASEQCLWIINKDTKRPWCLAWEEISHFAMQENGGVELMYFSSKGLKSFSLQAEGSMELADLYQLLSIQLGKMVNSPLENQTINNDSMVMNNKLRNICELDIPGISCYQDYYLFGSNNIATRWMRLKSKEDIDVIESCFTRVKSLKSNKSDYFASLDKEAWFLVDAWSHVYAGLNSRRRIVAGIINGTGTQIQIKQSKVEEGGSPCYILSSAEYDHDRSVLNPGGGMIFFAWGSSPSLNQAGKVFITIEANAFILQLSDRINSSIQARALTRYQVKFLEKSYDVNGWWAKYWILVNQKL